MANDNKGNEENPILGTVLRISKSILLEPMKVFGSYKKRTGKTVDKAHSEILHITAVSEFPQPFYLYHLSS